MAKDLTRIRRKRLTRMFAGEHGPTKSSESWQEIGHFIRGVSIQLKRLVELNGNNHVAESNCGWDAEGTLQPGQTTIADFRIAIGRFTGKRPLAWLCGEDQLWVFNYRKLSSKEAIDMRLSVISDLGYDSPREACFARVQGWIPTFQIFKVKDFKLLGNKLSYTILEELFPESEIAEGKIKITS